MFCTDSLLSDCEKAKAVIIRFARTLVYVSTSGEKKNRYEVYFILCAVHLALHTFL